MRKSEARQEKTKKGKTSRERLAEVCPACQCIMVGVEGPWDNYGSISLNKRPGV